MESRITAFIIAVCLCVSTLAQGATYRWKDKEGKIHYGAVVPAEYADQPYDVLNSAGMVIEHVEPATEPRVEEPVPEEPAESDTREPLYTDEERQRQSDYLLLVQYRSEAEIEEALNHELTQLGYDQKLTRQSHTSTSQAIRDNIRQAADQQRAGRQVGEEQERQIRKLYARLERDESKLAAIDTKEVKIRARFEADLKRYRELTSGNEEQQDQG